MVIRKIKESDLEELRSLYCELCDRELSLEGIKKAFMRVNDNKDYYLLGAEIEGKIVGTLMGIVCYDVASENQNFMTIENVVVGKLHRGKGICKALVHEIEKIAKANECNYIYLVSGENRKEAHALYSTLGYADENARGFRKHFK